MKSTTLQLIQADRPTSSPLDFLRDAPRRELFNVYSHLAGALLNATAVLGLTVRFLKQDQIATALGVAIFGLAMTLAYLASTIYHAAHGAERLRLRRLDRAAIFVAIAGFNIAGVMIGLPASWRLPVVLVLAGLAFAAARRELIHTGTAIRNTVWPYVLLGSIGLLSWKYLATTLTPAGLIWLLLALALGFLGALAFRTESLPRHHEIWHVLVLMANGSVIVGWSQGL